MAFDLNYILESLYPVVGNIFGFVTYFVSAPFQEVVASFTNFSFTFTNLLTGSSTTWALNLQFLFSTPLWILYVYPIAFIQAVGSVLLLIVEPLGIAYVPNIFPVIIVMLIIPALIKLFTTLLRAIISVVAKL